MNILECKALTKRYGGKSALEGVELSIEPGRIVGLLGPNGTAKRPSSSSPTVCSPPRAAEILIDGKAPRRRRRPSSPISPTATPCPTG